MPVTLSYPGVYIEELPSGVRTITGVSTSVAAFVDAFKWGPTNRAVQVLSFADFEREFGGLDSRSEASYAIQQFFANGGSEAWVVRVVTGTGGDTPLRANVQIRPDVSGSVTLFIEGVSEGRWAESIGLRVDDAPTAGEFNMTVTQYASVGGKESVAKQEIFRNLSMSSTASNFVRRILADSIAGSKLVRVEPSSTPGSVRPLLNGTQSADIAGPIAVANNSHVGVEIGSSGVVQLTLAGPQTTLAGVAGSLQEAIRAARPSNPAFANATVTVLGSRLLVRTSSAAADRIVFTNDGVDTTAGSLNLIAANGAMFNVQEYRLGSGAIAGTAVNAGAQGADGLLPSALSMIGSLAAKSGMYALEDVDLFNILCLPRAGKAASAATAELMTLTDARTIIVAAETYCETRRAFLLVDTPVGVDDPTKIKDFLGTGASIRHKNAALYYPRVQMPDPLDNGRMRSFGASGTLAGLYARTDSARGVWKAPAGTEASLRNVAALEDVLTDPENGTLNPLAINCLRNFPIFGPVSWGARTLDGADQQASEWKYVPVRRIALFLEESLYRGTKWVVFEPNDEPLWAQIRLNIGAFMQNLFRQGAFQGQTPRDAYFVKCDKETTTQNDINSGIVNIVVGFAPLKPAEFVVIKIQQMAGQIAT